MAVRPPLFGIRVVELAGLAPAPFCGMILSDFGASVIRVDKPGAADTDRLMRGKRSVALDLKNSKAVRIFENLCKRSDVLIEPFRAGVMERLGLGPQKLLADNPGLIYARLTGYGQDGPWSKVAGHDINYLALSGLLSMMGRYNERPLAPLNLVADFAGGGLTCAMGIVMALFERTKSGKGQVIDASMVEGASYVGSWVYKAQDMGMAWGQPRGRNMLDSGFPLYDCYETADGKFVAVGALEPQFQAEFLKRMDMQDVEFSDMLEKAELVRDRLKAKFRTKTRAEWEAIFNHSDSCVTPILEFDEAQKHPHNLARNTFHRNSTSDEKCGLEPNPAPKLSRTPAEPNFENPKPGQHTREVLKELGYAEKVIETLIKEKVVAEQGDGVANDDIRVAKSKV